MTLVLPGGHNVTAVKYGSLDIQQIKLGNTLYWSKAKIRDPFDIEGTLERWINELLSGDLGALCLDVTGTFVDGLGNAIGTVVAFVEGGVNGLGTLVADTGQAIGDVYCGIWGGSAAPDGLIGLINGIPIIGGALADWLTGSIDIDSIIGSIPLVNNLAQMIGLIPTVEGNLLDPINYVINAAGEVVGVLTCGEFRPTGSTAFEGVCFMIGVIGNAAKMLIPDGLLSLNKQISHMRHPDTLDFDDGYLETQIAEAGSPGYVTQVFRRYSNNGSGDNGVGLWLESSELSLVRRVGGTPVKVLDSVTSFSPGDTIRLDQVGNTHTLTRNGIEVGEWVDSGATAASGASNRSVAMWMEAAKELSGSRLFSPSLNYVEAA